MGSIGVGTREPARPGSATMARAAVSTDPTTSLEGRTRRRPYPACARIARRRRAGRRGRASRRAEAGEPTSLPGTHSRELTLDGLVNRRIVHVSARGHTRISRMCAYQAHGARARRRPLLRIVAPDGAGEGATEHRKRAQLTLRERGAQVATNARAVPRDADLTALNERRLRLLLGRSRLLPQIRRSRRRSGRGCPHHPGRAASPTRAVHSRWRSRAAR
jgi:hypothetical protein